MMYFRSIQLKFDPIQYLQVSCLFSPMTIFTYSFCCCNPKTFFIFYYSTTYRTYIIILNVLPPKIDKFPQKFITTCSTYVEGRGITSCNGGYCSFEGGCVDGGGCGWIYDTSAQKEEGGQG